VVDALRTPYGRRGGALTGWHPVDLTAELLEELVAANKVGPGQVDDVVLGCTSQVGAQAGNIARRAALAAGWPETVPGATVDRHAASSAQAVHWAAQAVMSGAQALVIAGGVEVMTAVPAGAPLAQVAIGKPYGPRLLERYRAGGGLLPPGLVAEEVARQWSLSRGALDDWALLSMERAAQAQKARPPFLIPLQRRPVPPPPVLEKSPPGRGRRPPPASLIVADEAVGSLPSRAKVAALAPVYLEGGVVTAANMAAEGDGAAAVLIASVATARALGLVPKARFLSFATAGADPSLWPMAAVPATMTALARSGLSAADIDRWYVHESSAAAVLAWAAETGAELGRVNADGGALATTSPVGAVGAGLFASAVAALAGTTNGLAVVCTAGEGGVGTTAVLARWE
jgi:acetyl-CoA acetyltransferase family protein